MFDNRFLDARYYALKQIFRKADRVAKVDFYLAVKYELAERVDVNVRIITPFISLGDFKGHDTKVLKAIKKLAERYLRMVKHRTGEF